jgi:hypothetical protein
MWMLIGVCVSHLFQRGEYVVRHGCDGVRLELGMRQHRLHPPLRVQPEEVKQRVSA